MLPVKMLLIGIAALTSFACMALLFRNYVASGSRLLLWSALCFVGLTLNNVALFADLFVLANIDLRIARLGAALVGMLFLIYGFIRESE
jgi:hypothetical protein